METIPVEGRILDLEGRPVAGATVSVKYVQSPPDGKLDAWIDEVKRLARQPFGLGIMPDAGPARAVLGDDRRDGRFRIDGLPRDGIATASIAGPGIETSEVYILTRDMPTIRVKNPMTGTTRPMLVYYGARFDHVAAKARPIVGTVRDKDTGAPIAGVHITGMPNIPTACPDARRRGDHRRPGPVPGHGLPTSRGFKLFTEAAGRPAVCELRVRLPRGRRPSPDHSPSTSP